MLFSGQRNQSQLDIEDPVISMLAEGKSYTFESRKEVEGFLKAGSTAVTIDLGAKLFRELVEWKSLPVHPLSVQVSEMEDWDKMKKIIDKLNALEAVFGMLNELTPKQREAFEKAVKRRPLFE